MPPFWMMSSIAQKLLFMVALYNRADHYIFLNWTTKFEVISFINSTDRKRSQHLQTGSFGGHTYGSVKVIGNKFNRSHTVFTHVMVCWSSISYGAVRPSVHPSQASIVSKWLNGSSSFLAQMLPLAYHTLCCKGIWVSPN